MEAKQNKTVKILGLLFVLATIFYVFYAGCSQRALYLDGSYWMVMFLNRISDNLYTIHPYLSRPRFMVYYLQHLPIDVVAFFFRNLTDKITYSTIFSFTVFTLPVLGLWWNYELTKRTKQYAVLFLSIFSYAAMILLYQVFSVVESCIGLPFQFVLLNYLLGKINYTKWDKIGIFFLIILMYGIYEYTIFLGVLIFAIMFTCLYDEENSGNLLTKIAIGAGSLGASAYTLFYILLSKEEQGEFHRFLTEATDFFPLWNKLNVLITIVTVLLIAYCLFFKKSKPLSKPITAIFCGIYIYLLFHMFGNMQSFLNPIYEQHMRSLPCWVVPIFFTCIFVARLKKIPEKKEILNNLYIPVLLCGITLTVWQTVTTFYWNENVSFLKDKIKSCETPLYFPSIEQNEEIASFFSPTLRRYIWNANCISTALALEPDYEIKKIIVHYDENEKTKDNPSKRAQQFVILEKGVIGMPYSEVIDIKNKFWDLSEPAKELDKYNRENSIQTLENEHENDLKINTLVEQRNEKN